MPYADPLKQKQYLKIWHKKFDKVSSKKRRLKHLKIIDEIKLKKGCKKCGYKQHPRALEFHHRNPKNKLFTIGSCKNFNLERIIKEIQKCDVLCSNCHRIEEHKLNKNSLY